MMMIAGKGGITNIETFVYIGETKSFQSCQSKERGKKAFFGRSAEKS